MDRQIDSPMPMPWDLVVKKRLENAVGVPWIDTATGVLHCNQKAARLVGLDGPMTEEPHLDRHRRDPMCGGKAG
jgi:hypothetical protein